MGKGELFECEECGHTWRTRGHGTKICPVCKSDNIIKESNKSAQSVKLKKAEEEIQKAEAQKREAELEIIKEERKRREKEELIGILGGKEYHRRISLIESSNTNNSEKNKLKKSLGMSNKDFENARDTFFHLESSLMIT